MNNYYIRDILYSTLLSKTKIHYYPW